MKPLLLVLIALSGPLAAHPHDSGREPDPDRLARFLALTPRQEQALHDLLRQEPDCDLRDPAIRPRLAPLLHDWQQRRLVRWQTPVPKHRPQRSGPAAPHPGRPSHAPERADRHHPESFRGVTP